MEITLTRVRRGTGLLQVGGRNTNLTLNKLSDEENTIVKEFIKEFLPMRNDKRKNPKNELSYVTDTVNRIISKLFGFKLSHKNILDAFLELDYKIYFISLVII